LLGRAIRIEEATEVSRMARRLAALVLLQPTLNENYLRVRKHAFHLVWPRAAVSTEGTRS